MEGSGKIKHSRPVPPFLRWCVTTIPAAFDDSLTYYEALCSLWKWLQTNLVEVVNNNATVTQEYIKMVDELKEFVDNYFDNLDVQEEINNKLDEMVEDGSLMNLISQYMPFIYVENYGAKGDGVTDDTQAFQAAINYAASHNGCIKLLSKTYVISNIELTGHISIIGNGQEQSVIKAKSGTTGNLITSSEFGWLYIHLADFKIDGNKENASLTSGLYIDRGPDHGDAHDSFITVERLLVSNVSGDGIYNGRGGRENRFINCVCEYCGGNGIKAIASDSYYEGNTCKLNTKNGIMVGCSASRFINNKCFLNGYENESNSREEIAGYLVDGYNNQFTNCDAQENYGDGFYVKQGPNTFINCIADANGFKSQRYNDDGSYADMTDEELVYDGFHIASISWYVRNSTFIVMATDHRRSSNHQLQRYGVYMGNCQKCIFNIVAVNNVEPLSYDSTFQINQNYYGADNYILLNGKIIGTIMEHRIALQNTDDTRSAIDIFTGTDNTTKARITSVDTRTFKIDNMTDNTYNDTPLSIRLNEINDGQINVGDSGNHYTFNVRARGIGFFGKSPVGQQAHHADATDLSSAITLINNIKTGLENLGLFKNS